MSVLTSIPTGTFLGTTHNNVAAAVFPVGQKITVKQDAATGVTPGFCTFIYYQYDDGTRASALAAAKIPVQLFAANTEQLCNDQDEINQFGPGAISIGAVTALRYAWFQCGGPICNGNALALAVATLDANFATDDSVVAKSLAQFIADDALGACTAGTDGEHGFILTDTADSNVSTGVGTIDAEFLYILDKFAPSL